MLSKLKDLEDRLVRNNWLLCYTNNFNSTVTVNLMSHVHTTTDILDGLYSPLYRHVNLLLNVTHAMFSMSIKN